MSKEYNESSGTVDIGGVSVKTIKRFQDSSSNMEVFEIDGFNDETSIDKDALKAELGEELNKQIEVRLEEIKEEVLKEKAIEKIDTQKSFEDSLAELEKLNVFELNEEYEKQITNNTNINKERTEKYKEEDLITEHKSETGTTVIVNTGNTDNIENKKKVFRIRYWFRSITRVISKSLLVIIFLLLVFLYLKPELAQEVVVVFDTHIIPKLGETLGPWLETLIRKFIDYAKSI